LTSQFESSAGSGELTVLREMHSGSAIGPTVTWACRSSSWRCSAELLALLGQVPSRQSALAEETSTAAKCRIWLPCLDLPNVILLVRLEP
jgi:hypothetical protein